MHSYFFLFSFLLGTLGLLGGVTRAAAQEHDGRADRPLRLYGGLWLGFGGEMETEARGPLGFELGATDDLMTTVGGQIGIDAVVFRYLALGGEVRFGGFNTEAGDDADVDRSRLVDIDFKPRLRFVPRRTPLELYATVPIGLTIARVSDDLLLDDAGVDEKLGWNLGIGGGLTYFVADRFGINVEPIWLMHWFSLDGPVRTSADVSLRQFSLLVNAVIAL